MLDCNSSSSALTVKFWGVRGGTPSSGAAYQQYGGNTGCVEVVTGPQRLIFDAGTGLCSLGQHLLKTGASTAHLFLSKPQWGRTQGLPFFGPAFEPRNQFWIYGPVAITGASIRHQLMNQLRLPYSDVSLHHLQADLAFQDLNPGHSFMIKESAHRDIALEVMQINPDSRALGYRVSFGNIKIVYATTFEQALDAEILEDFINFAAGANLLIYGESGTGWWLRKNTSNCCKSVSEGSSTAEAFRTLKMFMQHSLVQQVIVTQHPPFSSDEELRQREEKICTQFDKIRFAREGMQLTFQTSPMAQA